MTPGAPSHKFRSMMQNLWLNKLKNSPQRRIQNTVAWMVSHSPTARRESIINKSGEENNDTNESRKHCTEESTVSHSLPSSMPFISSSTLSSSSWQHQSLPASQSSFNFPSSWLPSSLTSSTSARVAAQRFRDKVQEALHTATCKVEEVLQTSHEAETDNDVLTSSNNSNNNNNSSSSNTSDNASKFNELNTKNGSPESFYSRVQETLRGTREYYSSIPFDERWDDIQGSLAVLGRVSTCNSVTPYRDSGEAFAAMWHAVDNGQREVLWQTYICKDDYVGQVTVHKLVEAHTRGCMTELLYDSGGNISGRGRLTEELRLCGARVITYRPFFRGFVQYMFGGLDWRISPGLRNHRKILLVDNEVGFCGGLNIGNEYCGISMGGTGTFRDTHCAVRGPAVLHLREVYENTKLPQHWKFGWRRWRQIASFSMNRQYKLSRRAMETNWIRPIQTQTRNVTRRGGIYFYKQLRKAGVQTERMIGKLRWQKQRDQLMEWMHWYREHIAPRKRNRNNNTDNTEHNNKQNSQESANNAKRTAEQLEHKHYHNDCENGSVNGNNKKNDSVKEEEQQQQEEEEEEGNNKGAHCSGISNRVMKRKVSEARLRALSSATDMSHKRSYTRILLHTPINDDEPVPEAEMYSLHRPSSTQILHCNPRYHEYSIQYALWQVTRKCHRRLWLTTPYYLPTRKLLKALQRAARRGVDVRILAGSRQTTDPWFMWHASSYITEHLLRSGVRIYEYKGNEIMHAKTIVVDSVWSSIGSYNWDLLSNKNLEVCLCHLDASLAREMEAHFLYDLRQSEEIALEHHTSRSWWLRFTSWLFYHGVYLVNRLTFFSYINDDVEDSGYFSEH